MLKLVKRFYMSDIREYEEDTGISVLSLFDKPSITGLIDLIVLGNRGMKEARAYELMDEYTEEKDMLQAYLEIKECLLGKQDFDENDSHNIQTKKYTYLTDLYQDMSTSLISLGITYTEFWSMSTREMYKVFDSINIKAKNDINRELSMNHTLANMIGSAFAGKLPRKAPQIGDDSDDIKDGHLEGIEGELGATEIKNILAMKAITARRKKGAK